MPLPGSVPDMKSQSKTYVQLQSIYKKKARQDVAEVLEMVKASSGDRQIDTEEVELFCKNAAFVKLINATRGEGGNTKIDNVDRLKEVVGR